MICMRGNFQCAKQGKWDPSQDWWDLFKTFIVIVYNEYILSQQCINTFCESGSTRNFICGLIKDQAKITLRPISSASLFTPTDLKVSIVQESMSVSKIVNSRAFRSWSLVHTGTKSYSITRMACGARFMIFYVFNYILQLCSNKVVVL